MKCIILAAGYATRLYPLTENFPKPLLEVGGKPILDWLIEDLSTEVDEFIVVTNHKFAAIFDEWAMKKEKVRIIDDGTSSNEGRLGAVKDIQLAAEGIFSDARDVQPSADKIISETRDVEPGGTDNGSHSASRDTEGDVFVMAGDNVLTFSLVPFIKFSQKKGTSCVMCHDEKRLEALQRTAVITVDENNYITSYEEKPKAPKGELAVPPFYYYRAGDIKRIEEALDAGCGYDAPGSFAAWLSKQTPMHALKMTGSRYDIGDMASYEAVRDSYKGIEK